jgi:hypothetical protein
VLEIRREQMRLFEVVCRKGFQDRLLAKLLRNTTFERGWLEAQIARGVAAAPAFELTMGGDIASMIETTCRHIPGGFPEIDPTNLPVPALAILRTRGMPASSKLERYRIWAAGWDGEREWR